MKCFRIIRNKKLWGLQLLTKAKVDTFHKSRLTVERKMAVTCTAPLKRQIWNRLQICKYRAVSYTQNCVKCNVQLCSIRFLYFYILSTSFDTSEYFFFTCMPVFAWSNYLQSRLHLKIKRSFIWYSSGKFKLGQNSWWKKYPCNVPRSKPTQMLAIPAKLTKLIIFLLF